MQKKSKIKKISKTPFQNVYQFKIVLNNTKPIVYRVIQVPEYYSFYDLHVAIQDALGWMDYHLHGFQVKTEQYIACIDCPQEQEESNVVQFGHKHFLGTETQIKDFLNAGDSFEYTYDFGDNWRHKLTLEKILPKENNKVYPVCLSGKRACPPEDCGSLPGYEDCIAAVKTKNNAELLEWLGDWNPDEFNPEDVYFRDPQDALVDALECSAQ
jgi:hypothetical protein